MSTPSSSVAPPPGGPGAGIQQDKSKGRSSSSLSASTAHALSVHAPAPSPAASKPKGTCTSSSVGAPTAAAEQREDLDAARAPPTAPPTATPSPGSHTESHTNPSTKARTKAGVGMLQQPRKVVLVWNKRLVECCSRLLCDQDKLRFLDGLLSAYGLLKSQRIGKTGWFVVEPQEATRDDLEEYHDADYLEFMEEVSDASSPLDSEETFEKCREYGLFDDCPAFPGLFDYVKMSAGATLTAVKALKSGASLAINWSGGRHHAQREKASGFCYVNDIVLGIFSLLEDRRFSKVLYIDLDAHHGDAVEEAFIQSEDVFTLSFHHHAPTFFPGTGSIDSVGKGKGAYRSLNIPFKKGVSDTTFLSVVSAVSRAVHKMFAPSCVVVQCGCDGMGGDPTQAGNLTTKGFSAAFASVLQLGSPTLVLGGGGYHPANVARCWANITGLCAGVKLAETVPDHDLMMTYSPYFKLHTEPLNSLRDANADANGAHIQRLVAAVKTYQRRYFASKLPPGASAAAADASASATPTLSSFLEEPSGSNATSSAARCSSSNSNSHNGIGAASHRSLSLSENKENRSAASSGGESLSLDRRRRRSASLSDRRSVFAVLQSASRSRHRNIASGKAASSATPLLPSRRRPSSAPPTPPNSESNSLRKSSAALDFRRKLLQRRPTPRVLMPRPTLRAAYPELPPEFLMPPPLFLPKRFYVDGQPVFARPRAKETPPGGRGAEMDTNMCG